MAIMKSPELERRLEVRGVEVEQLDGDLGALRQEDLLTCSQQ